MDRTPLRGDDVRIRNEKLVLHIIFRGGIISQSQVVQETGLKAPTVFRIFAKLEEGGFIRQCDGGAVPRELTKVERRGRRPSYYEVVPECRYAVGVDFSSLAAAVITVDFSNAVIHHETVDLPEDPDRDTILSALETLIASALKKHDISIDSLLGIGIASPGLVDTESGVVLEYRRIAGLQGFSIKDHFESRFRAPVFVHNNASIIAASAYQYGVARDEKNLLAILVRSGVGGALINHGNVLLNGTATALEIGRTSVHCIAPETTVDEMVSLESIVSEQPLLERLNRSHRCDSWEQAERDLTTVQISEALTEARSAIATAAINLNHVFHPNAILVISRFDSIARVLGESIQIALPHCRVTPMVYDPVQACYGATDLVFRRFFGYSRTPDTTTTL